LPILTIVFYSLIFLDSHGNNAIIKRSSICVSASLPFSSGTLRSHLTRTLFPLRSSLLRSDRPRLGITFYTTGMKMVRTLAVKYNRTGAGGTTILGGHLPGSASSTAALVFLTCASISCSFISAYLRPAAYIQL
jgi:hypothetical protein